MCCALMRYIYLSVTRETSHFEVGAAAAAVATHVSTESVGLVLNLHL